MRRNPEVCEMPVPCCRECELDSSFHPKVWLTKFSLSKCLNLCLSLLIDEVLQSTLETFGSTYHNYTDLLTKANERDLWKFLSSQTQCIHVAPAQLSLQAGRSIAGNLGSNQSARQQRECSSVVDDVPSERALSGVWFINSPFKSFLKACPAGLFLCSPQSRISPKSLKMINHK